MLCCMLACHSIQPETKRVPKKVVIRGVFATRTSDDVIYPIMGRKVYVLNSQYVRIANDTLMREFNWIWYAYMKYVRLKSDSWTNGLAKKWKRDVLEVRGIKSEADFDSAMSRVMRDGHSVMFDTHTREITLSSTGEYSFNLDSGRYFVLINTSVDDGSYYGGWINTTDSVNDFSRNLWSDR